MPLPHSCKMVSREYPWLADCIAGFSFHQNSCLFPAPVLHHPDPERSFFLGLYASSLRVNASSAVWEKQVASMQVLLENSLSLRIITLMVILSYCRWNSPWKKFPVTIYTNHMNLDNLGPSFSHHLTSTYHPAEKTHRAEALSMSFDTYVTAHVIEQIASALLYIFKNYSCNNSFS